MDAELSRAGGSARLNPFDIRATAWTAFAAYIDTLGSLNPFDIRATAWTLIVAQKAVGSSRLNPFDIRATAWTVKSVIEQATKGLNPFDIRATAWTFARSLNADRPEVLIPLISGQPLGHLFCGELLEVLKS